MCSFRFVDSSPALTVLDRRIASGLSFMQNDRWTGYHAATAGRNPRKLLLEALPYVQNKGAALDLGAGDLVDSHFLSNEGFSVTAVDSSESSLSISQRDSNPGIRFIRADFDAFKFVPSTYTLISAQFALPFNRPETFVRMFTELKSSLAKGGILVCQFFGTRDGWSADKTMTFHTREEVESLISGLEVLKFAEEEAERPTASGALKHWHVFEVIARKS